jgi:serine phosphatase RsbU (regulator of sigma subunit)
VSSPPYDALTIAVAGHPPPVVVKASGEAAFAEVEKSLPLGAIRTGRARRSTTITIAPDTTVVFFTDGLVERRGESIDVGLERLRTAATSGRPERVAAEIMRSVVADTIPQDDIALVVVHRRESK